MTIHIGLIGGGNITGTHACAATAVPGAEVISCLARRALAPTEPKVKTRNGVPLLKVRKGARRVTSELVNQLREELP